MKLLVAIIDARDARTLRDALAAADVHFTEIGSIGGFLRHGNTTLLIGVTDERVGEVEELIRAHCQPREEVVNLAHASSQVFGDPLGRPEWVTLGSGLIFVLNVEQTLTW